MINSKTVFSLMMGLIFTGLCGLEQAQPESPFVIRPFKPLFDNAPVTSGVAYGFYRKGQAPWGSAPSDAELVEDLEIISRHWHLIRLYNAEETAGRVLALIRKNNFPISVMLGIWLENEQERPDIARQNLANVITGIDLANGYPDIVSAVSVGNETQVFWSAHRMNSDDLIRYLRRVRNAIQQPVTTADDYNFWNKPESQSVARETDFVVTHLHPLWNGKTLDNTFAWVDETMKTLTAIHPDKSIVVGEIGWATALNPEKNGPGEQGTLVKGEVGHSGQERFLVLLDSWMSRTGVTTFLFEAFDESWKGGANETGADEIEKNWGVFHEDRTPKPSFTNFLKSQDTNHTKETWRK